MMINKRLIGTVADSKKYIAGSVIFQWIFLAANIAMMTSITWLFQELFFHTAAKNEIIITVCIAAAAAVIVRFLCTVGSNRMSYFSSKVVKRTPRKNIPEAATFRFVLPRAGAVLRGGPGVGGGRGMQLDSITILY